ncbi:MAG: hypothetical protein DLM52_13080 [Chthoniobacterales bacterium]|nr:MAG: hypothetical protein DLM52_13080 [Chthoniobacterales bacterium]
MSRSRWLLLILLFIAGLLQFSLARRQSLWADEFFSLAMATGHSLEHRASDARAELGDFVEPQSAVPAEQLRRYLQHETPPASPARVVRAVLLSDTSPPLYYLLLWGWTVIFGTSDLTLRLFSVSCSIASLPLVAAVAQRIAGKWAAIVSCVLFAFSPLVIYYSTEGRMYSLLIFLALATAWISLVLQERGAHIGLCLLWIALSAAGFLTHYFFVFPWLANFAFLLLQPGKFQRRWLLLCSFATGLLILPWVWVAAGWWSSWRVTQGWLNWKPDGFNRARALLGQFTQFFYSEGHGLWWTPRWSRLSVLALFALAAAWAAWRQRERLFAGKNRLLWLWIVAGCAGPTAIDLLQHTYTAAVPRYALGAVPAACMLAGVAIASLGPRLALALVCLIVVAWAPALRNIYHQSSRSAEPVREIAQTISALTNPSELILVHSIPSGVLGIARYVQTAAPISSWVGQLGNRHVPESIEKLGRDRSRILLVKLHEVGAAAPEEDWLRVNARISGEQRFGAARLIDFRPLNSDKFQSHEAITK